MHGRRNQTFLFLHRVKSRSSHIIGGTVIGPSLRSLKVAFPHRVSGRLFQINVFHPPGEKESFSISLCVGADGVKHPAVIVFKRSARTGVLSKKLVDALIVSDDILVISSRSVC